MVPLKDLMAGAKSKVTPSNPPVDEEGATTTIDLKQVLGADLEKARAEILARLDRGDAAPPAAPPAPQPGAAAEQPDVVSQKTLQSAPIPAMPEPSEPQAAPPAPEVSYAGDATIVSADLAKPPQSPAKPAPPPPRVDAGDATVVDMMIPSALAGPAPSAAAADVDATVVGAALPPPPKPAAAPKAAPAAGGFWGNAAPGGAGAKTPASSPKPAAPAAAPPTPTPPAPKAAAPVTPPAAAKPAPPPAPSPAPVQVPAPSPVAAAAASPQPDATAGGSGSRLLRLIVWLVIIIGAIAAGAYFMLKDYQFEEVAVVNVIPTPVAEEQPTVAPPPVTTVPPLAEFSGGLTTTPVVLAQQVEGATDEPQVAPPATTTSAPAPRPVRQPTPRVSAVREVAPAEPVAPREEVPPPPPPAAEGDLVHIDQPGVTPPRLTTDEPARYPVRARMAGAKGTVTLSLLIDHQGRVAEATVARSAGNDLLDNSAILAAKKSVYSPAMKDGVRVRVWISRDYTFQP